MNYYFITGTSRGIGKALADELLQNKDNFVYGISRSKTIDKDNYFHYLIDLSGVNKVKNFKFFDLEKPDSITLINNSASIGEIIHVGKATQEEIINNYNINIVSPALLINSFLKKYQSSKCRRIIMNISSGAAKSPVESWSTYCASKSALAMLSEVVDLEQKLNHPADPVFIFSVAPGIVDTQAQRIIRSTPSENFSKVNRFIEFKDNNELSDPKDVAKKLLLILNSPENFRNVALDVRNF
ncbi:MAG: SDR family NAD(P)-dependent oxidoreductase [bacterium]